MTIARPEPLNPAIIDVPRCGIVCSFVSKVSYLICSTHTHIPIRILLAIAWSNPDCTYVHQGLAKTCSAWCCFRFQRVDSLRHGLATLSHSIFQVVCTSKTQMLSRFHTWLFVSIYFRLKHLCLEIQEGCSPLHLAAANGHSDLIAVLCRAGADIESTDDVSQNLPCPS